MALPPAPAGARLTFLTPRVRLAIAAVLSLVVVVCVALLAWMAMGGRASADGGLDFPDEREQAMSLTDQFVKRLGTYSPDMVDDSGQMPDYRAQVREVITPKFAADFDKQVATAEQVQGDVLGLRERIADALARAGVLEVPGVADQRPSRPGGGAVVATHHRLRGTDHR